MSLAPEISYDPLTKVWSSEVQNDHFAPDSSIGELIFHEMRRHPKLIAQISDTENTILTREELLLNSMRVACYMRNLGLLQTDIVGIIARNTTHLSAVAYACFFNGIAFHAVSVFHEQNTIGKLFNITKPRIIFCDGDEYEKVLEATRDLGVKIITMRNHPAGSLSIEDVLKTPVEKNFKPARLEQGNNQTLAINCTSGSTGEPKVSMCSNSRKILNDSLMLTTSDVQYSSSSLDWITGVFVTVVSGVFSTTRIITDQTFESEEVLLHLIEKYKITWILLVPSSVALMASCQTFETTNLDSLRYCIYAGGPCSLKAQHRFRKRLHGNILHCAYGLTEIGIWAAFNWNFDEKPNSVGRLSPGLKLKILDNQNETVGPNNEGKIYLNTGHYWAGYYGNPEESSSMDSHQWFQTGDLGYVDEDGFLYIVGREKDLLRSTRIDYFPSEIEAVISQMPQVSEVCVFGIWHEINGDEAAAAIVKKPDAKLDANDMIEYVKLKLDESDKHLKRGAIIVDQLKRSPNGKINRAANKAHFMQLFGLKDTF